MKEHDFVISGRRIRVVVNPDGAAYCLYRIGTMTLVQKADGSHYQIDHRGKCSCRGFKYRGTCKHVSWNREGL